MSKVALIGCGSVGSMMADILVRSGHKIAFLIDSDVVEIKNRSKSIYTSVDVGRKKVEVLKEHLQRIAPELEINAIDKFSEDLSDKEWDKILAEADMILEMADSRSGSEACVQKLKENYEVTKKQHILVKMICLDNIASGFTMIWSKGLNVPCPCCLFKATPLINTSDERSEKNDAEYTSERITGTPVKGVLPDLLYGLSLTSSLIHGLLQSLEGVSSGRDSLVGSFLNGSNIFIWSSFRNPFFDWQKESREGLMGTARPLSLNTSSSCPYCGLNIEEEINSQLVSREGGMQ